MSRYQNLQAGRLRPFPGPPFSPFVRLYADVIRRDIMRRDFHGSFRRCTKRSVIHVRCSSNDRDLCRWCTTPSYTGYNQRKEYRLWYRTENSIFDREIPRVLKHVALDASFKKLLEYFTHRTSRMYLYYFYLFGETRLWIYTRSDCVV